MFSCMAEASSPASTWSSRRESSHVFMATWWRRGEHWRRRSRKSEWSRHFQLWLIQKLKCWVYIREISTNIPTVKSVFSSQNKTEEDAQEGSQAAMGWQTLVSEEAGWDDRQRLANLQRGLQHHHQGRKDPEPHQELEGVFAACTHPGSHRQMWLQGQLEVFTSGMKSVVTFICKHM